MGNADSLARQRYKLGKRAHRLEEEGRYDEAASVHAERDAIQAELDELRRLDRVGRRRARIRRNYGIVSGGLVLTAVEDVLPLLRAAVEIDRAYLPDSYPS